jgi:O-methyltransferase
MQYIERNAIIGDIVECGVWKGGSALLVSKVLESSDSDRKIWLYDTYAGMSEPSILDKKIGATISAQEMLDRSTKSTEPNVWAYAPLEEVRRNILENTSLLEDRFNFVVGDVAETLLKDTPQKIALLRLDTDWSESTRAELNHLYEKVVLGGRDYY